MRTNRFNACAVLVGAHGLHHAVAPACVLADLATVRTGLGAQLDGSLMPSTAVCPDFVRHGLVPYVP